MSSVALSMVTTNKIREKMAKAIGETGRIARVVEIALGVGGVDTNGQPIMPKVEDNSLRNEVLRLPIDAVTYPLPTTVEFEIALNRPEHNGHEFTEMGIVDEDGDFVGIQTFPVKTKDEISLIKFFWDIEF